MIEPIRGISFVDRLSADENFWNQVAPNSATDFFINAGEVIFVCQPKNRTAVWVNRPPYNHWQVVPIEQLGHLIPKPKTKVFYMGNGDGTYCEVVQLATWENFSWLRRLDKENFTTGKPFTTIFTSLLHTEDPSLPTVTFDTFKKHINDFVPKRIYINEDELKNIYNEYIQTKKLFTR